MALFTPTVVKRLRVADLGQEESKTAVHVAARLGKVFFIHPTTGLATLASITNLAAAGMTATRGAVLGVAITAPSSTLPEESVTLVRDADLEFGAALDALEVGAPLWLGANGTLDTAAPAGAGAPLIQIGHVTATWREDTFDKLFRVNTLDYARAGFTQVAS